MTLIFVEHSEDKEFLMKLSRGLQYYNGVMF